MIRSKPSANGDANSLSVLPGFCVVFDSYDQFLVQGMHSNSDGYHGPWEDSILQSHVVSSCQMVMLVQLCSFVFLVGTCSFVFLVAMLCHESSIDQKSDTMGYYTPRWAFWLVSNVPQEGIVSAVPGYRASPRRALSRSQLFTETAALHLRGSVDAPGALGPRTSRVPPATPACRSSADPNVPDPNGTTMPLPGGVWEVWGGGPRTALRPALKCLPDI